VCAFVVLVLVSFYAKRLAGKNVSEMTYFVSSERKTLTQSQTELPVPLPTSHHAPPLLLVRSLPLDCYVGCFVKGGPSSTNQPSYQSRQR